MSGSEIGAFQDLSRINFVEPGFVGYVSLIAHIARDELSIPFVSSHYRFSALIVFAERTSFL
jgi:hypothetical protein